MLSTFFGYCAAAVCIGAGAKIAHTEMTAGKHNKAAAVGEFMAWIALAVIVCL